MISNESLWKKPSLKGVLTSVQSVLVIHVRSNLNRNCSPLTSYSAEGLFFPFLSERKENPQSWRRREEDAEGKEDAAMEGGPPAPIPLSLYEESATGARWLCAFLKHQLPEWSCREAMHCGTGVSTFVIIFDCLSLKISLYCSWYCGVYLTRTVSVVICFKSSFVALLVI